MRSAPRRPVGPPDFIGVGAEGPAAEWWHAALVAHPQIREPRGRRRALHFFDPFCERELRPADIAAYHGRFPRRAGTISGEWTGRYMSDGWVPPLLRRVAPGARLLVMVSDPIERYRTVHAERMALKEEGRRLVMTDVVDRASHASQLARLLRYYERDRILVLQYERCRRDPLGEYRRTLRFLGVRDDVLPRGLGRSAVSAMGLLGRLRRMPPAPSQHPTSHLWPELEAALQGALRPEAEALAAMVPELDVALWPNFAQTSSSVTASWPTSRNSV